MMRSWRLFHFVVIQFPVFDEPLPRYSLVVFRFSGFDPVFLMPWNYIIIMLVIVLLSSCITAVLLYAYYCVCFAIYGLMIIINVSIWGFAFDFRIAFIMFLPIFNFISWLLFSVSCWICPIFRVACNWRFYVTCRLTLVTMIYLKIIIFSICLTSFRI